jgi:hypothetical protein
MKCNHSIIFFKLGYCIFFFANLDNRHPCYTCSVNCIY